MKPATVTAPTTAGALSPAGFLAAFDTLLSTLSAVDAQAVADLSEAADQLGDAHDDRTGDDTYTAWDALVGHLGELAQLLALLTDDRKDLADLLALPPEPEEAHGRHPS